MDERRPGPYARLLLHGRLAALVALSVVAGGVGGAWAVAGAPGLDRTTVVTVADDSAAGESAEPKASKEPKPAKTGRPTDVGKPSDAAKPSKAAKAPKTGRDAAADGPRGVHGRCVSAVARSDANGGPHKNHGGAVSKAAQSCPHPTPSGTATD